MIIISISCVWNVPAVSRNDPSLPRGWPQSAWFSLVWWTGSSFNLYKKRFTRKKEYPLLQRHTRTKNKYIYIYVNKNARRRALTAVCGVSPWEHHQAMSSLVLMHRGWRRKGSEPLLGVTWMDPPPKVEEINVALVLMSAAANNLPHDSSFATS